MRDFDSGGRNADQRQQAVRCLEFGELREQRVVELGLRHIGAGFEQGDDLGILQRLFVHQQMQWFVSGIEKGSQQMRTVEQRLPCFAPLSTGRG